MSASLAAPPLASVQRLLQAEIREAAGSPHVRALVAGDARADAATRIGIYVEAYRLRLVEVLANDFPGLRAALGAAAFDRLARAYLDAHPSTTRSVRWFGRALGAFLASTAPWSRRPALAELARFEWAQGEVFDAPDDEALSIDAVGAIPPERWAGLRLLPRAALCRLDLASNAPALVVARFAGQTLPRLRAARRARAWLLWRDAALDVRWRSMNADEAAAWDTLAAGETFGTICERLCDHVDAETAPMHAASLLKRWLADGLIHSYELPS